MDDGDGRDLAPNLHRPVWGARCTGLGMIAIAHGASTGLREPNGPAAGAPQHTRRNPAEDLVKGVTCPRTPGRSGCKVARRADSSSGGVARKRQLGAKNFIQPARDRLRAPSVAATTVACKKHTARSIR